jgi:predicted short-subunit dehydrogenase-like oxidoreductase (DUF2520 family)
MAEKQRFALFGASRVGISLAYHFAKIGFEPVFVWNRSDKRLQIAQKWVKFKKHSTIIEDLKNPVDWIIIAVSDDAIEGVATRIAELDGGIKGVKVFHTSGFLSDDVLISVQKQGALTGAFHPVLSVSDIESGIARYPTAIFTCSGIIQKDLQWLAQQIGKEGLILNQRQKELVHISAVFLSNYSVALVAAVKALFKKNAIPEEKARLIFEEMAEMAIDRAWHNSFSQTLTGPLARNDVQMVKKHLRFLEEYPDLKHLYSIFGILSLNLLEGTPEIETASLRHLFQEALSAPS